MPKEISSETNDKWKCNADEAYKDTYPFDAVFPDTYRVRNADMVI